MCVHFVKSHNFCTIIAWLLFLHCTHTFVTIDNTMTMILFLNGWLEYGDNQIAYLGAATKEPGLTPLATAYNVAAG